MALTTPQLLSTAAFDASEAHVFRFNVVGGDQVVKNQLIIKNNETLEVVYNREIITFSFEHIVPSGTLSNGVNYQATITTFDSDGNASSPSTPISFYCYSVPTLDWKTWPDPIPTSSYTFSVTYNQLENELLNSYVFNLYDIQGVIAATSGVKFVGTTSLPPTTLSYTAYNLKDATTYYLEFTGTTLAGMAFSSGRVQVNVNYEVPVVFTFVELKNNCEEGYISINTNFVGIHGTSNPDPPIYVKDNTAVDVRGNGHYISYETGYAISGDFTASAWVYDLNLNTTIITLKASSGQTLEIGYYEDFLEEGKVYVDCKVTDGRYTYYIYSNSIDMPKDEDKVQIWFRRVRSLYEIQFHNLGGG